ncbi:MAG: helix-turn-helix transcriptional regulator [Bryobacterales bacterium]|nr:helix-turn-helix transcriptional regulator [Bryobacterales bacterium]
MKLGQKIRYLRLVEGTLRGLGREMTQQEVVRAMRREKKRGVSQSYLSQIENGARPHLTNSTRMMLAGFFGVHPGYLVDDPEGYHSELVSDVRVLEDQLDLWLIGGAERFSRDPKVGRALLKLAEHQDSRGCLVLLSAILDTPQLAERLMSVLAPEARPGERHGAGAAPADSANSSSAAALSSVLPRVSEERHRVPAASPTSGKSPEPAAPGSVAPRLYGKREKKEA